VLDGVPVALIPPTGSPVAFVRTPEDGVPKAGVTSVGDVPNTKAPDPVSPVTVAAKFALDGVAKNVATPVPNPDTPVEMGKPVALVNVADEGVPNAGVTSVGEVASTMLPLPVAVSHPKLVVVLQVTAVAQVDPKAAKVGNFNVHQLPGAELLS
jgi:hypothetical protein